MAEEEKEVVLGTTLQYLKRRVGEASPRNHSHQELLPSYRNL